jgi:hypothetical protein
VAQNQQQLAGLNALMERLSPSQAPGRWLVIGAAAIVLLLLAGYVLGLMSLVRMRQSLARIESRTPDRPEPRGSAVTPQEARFRSPIGGGQ